MCRFCSEVATCTFTYSCPSHKEEGLQRLEGLAPTDLLALHTYLEVIGPKMYQLTEKENAIKDCIRLKIIDNFGVKVTE